jgi:hypothetical protein
MNSSQVPRRMPVLLIALLFLSLVIAAGVYSRSSEPQKNVKDHQRTYQADKVKIAPQVVSKIPGLEISGVNLIDQGTAQASIAIEVTNNRDTAVMALDFVAGKPETTSGGIAMDGLLANPPREIIPAHTLERFVWHLGGIMEGETVFLAAAIFSDGKEEGAQGSLDTIKRTRIDTQPKRSDEKPGNGGPQ